MSILGMWYPETGSPRPPEINDREAGSPPENLHRVRPFDAIRVEFGYIAGPISEFKELPGDVFHRHGGLIISLVFIGAMTWIFGWLLDQQMNPNRANLVRVLDSGEREVVLKQNRSGHYVADGEINGRPVRFFLDTGATFVSIPDRIAQALGLTRGAAMRARTANGETTVYAGRLDRVRLGHIELGNVPAIISPNMGGEDVLLGMSFLSELELVQQGEELRLRVPKE